MAPTGNALGNVSVNTLKGFGSEANGRGINVMGVTGVPSENLVFEGVLFPTPDSGVITVNDPELKVVLLKEPVIVITREVPPALTAIEYPDAAVIPVTDNGVREYPPVPLFIENEYVGDTEAVTCAASKLPAWALICNSVQKF